MSTQTMTTPPHGVKRRGDDSIESEQRLSKRFDLLNLEHNSKLWVPVSAVAPNTNTNASTHPPTSTSASPSSTAAATFDHNPYYPRHDTLNVNASASNYTSHTTYPANDSMHLDDTPHKIYIHNLDEELSSLPDASSSNERLIFLPDIERKLGRIPRHILQGAEAQRPSPSVLGNEIVLYEVPRSLSVPVESDGVRRAVVEARRRAREEQQQQQQQQQRGYVGKGSDERTEDERVVEDMALGAERRRQVEGGDSWQSERVNGVVDEDPDAMDLG